MTKEKATYNNNGHRERVRTLVREKGLDSLAPHQVLEFLLFLAIPRKDTKPIANELLTRFGNIEGVFAAPEKDLQEIKGMTENAVILIKYLPDALNYYQKLCLKRQTSLTPKDILPYLMSLFSTKSTECMYIICLDAKMRLITTQLLSEGNDVSVKNSTKIILETALKYQSKNVILAHNHPSEIVTPSDADIKSTIALDNFLASLNIKLTDHIIIGRDSAYSFYMKSRLVDGGIPADTYPFIKLDNLKTFKQSD